jgi:antitoxin component of MazEF toxin-antitoxin module
MTTKTRIVRIGNSRGIRVPKLLLDQAELPDEVELRGETSTQFDRRDWHW